MIALKHPVIVEGKYDKIRLASFVSTPVFVTHGFGLFRDPQTRSLVRQLSQAGPLIVLTDSDRGGERIRNGIRGFCPGAQLIHVYTPCIAGKEKRKQTPSKQGLLGVEGLTEELLSQLFYRHGLVASQPEPQGFLDRARLYADGLLGGPQSKARRLALCRHLELPTDLSTTAFLQVLNRLCDEQTYQELLCNL